jgi:hypothetical protein
LNKPPNKLAAIIDLLLLFIINSRETVDHAIREKKEKRNKKTLKTKGISHKNAFQVEDDILCPPSLTVIKSRTKRSIEKSQHCGVVFCGTKIRLTAVAQLARSVCTNQG